MELSIKSKLDNILGKTYNYKGKNISIEKYKEVGGTNTVIFTPTPINLLNSEVEEFLNNLFDPIKREIAVTEVFVPQSKLISFEPTKENRVMKDTLLATLEKLKNDPNYLPQAKAICEVTSVMVDLQKNEIQMLNILNKMK